jgi:hypothetical protein
MPNAGTLAKDGNSYVFAAEGCESVAFVSTKGARRACARSRTHGRLLELTTPHFTVN